MPLLDLGYFFPKEIDLIVCHSWIFMDKPSLIRNIWEEKSNRIMGYFSSKQKGWQVLTSQPFFV